MSKERLMEQLQKKQNLLNKVITVGIALVILLIVVASVSWKEYKDSKAKIDLLEERNQVSFNSIQRFKEDRKEYSIILANEIHKKDSIAKVIIKYEIVLHILIKELKNIKGKYRKVSNDSLRNLLIKDYEIDNDTIVSH